MSLKRALVAGLCLLLLSCSSSDSASQPQLCSEREAAWESIKGYPYVWGGESVEEGGFDCSGAIYAVQKRIGEPIPRTTSKKLAILADGKRKHWSEGNCSDWIWFTFSSDRPFGHVGMHINATRVWQSGSSTGPTPETLFQGSYWDRNFEVTKGLRGE